MKVLIIGSGGREHAIAWKLAQSEKIEKIFAAPGNGGAAGEEKCENVPASSGGNAAKKDWPALVEFAGENEIDFTVVGPEVPLADGIVDHFRAAGLAIIGPDKKAARLESSKVYSKSFMGKYGVRAAKSKNFTGIAEARNYAKKYFSASLRNAAQAAPLVIKADGLAAGKGVVIASGLKEAEEAIASFMKKKSLGEAGTSVVLEEFLEGREVSVLAAVSVSGGRGTIAPFISARDHKRRFEGGKGPNTGGMGAIAPVPDFTAAAQKDFRKAVLEPTLKGIKKEGMDYRGFIFFGLMVKDDRCFLLEYNVRLGDPETQAVLPLLNSDLADLCTAILNGNLNSFPLKWKKGAVCAPVAAAEGYPGSYRKGDPIAINEAAFKRTGAHLFAAGASRGAGGPFGSGLRTAGGRVLTVSAFGNNADEARETAYRALGAINFEGMCYRKDIGRE
ncbi:MAG: phosphoribosylamine--glycine ligase [Treponema sp.]|jgi:phosphoribosylamine--glycine ligase|nr:phosphoribosylamine--glycine ligase [Treponema sp.]